MVVVLCTGSCVSRCVGVVVVVAALDDVDPVAECIFAGDQTCAVVGKMRGHVEGDVRSCFRKGSCEVAADDDSAVRFSVSVGCVRGSSS